MRKPYLNKTLFTAILIFSLFSQRARAQVRLIPSMRPAPNSTIEVPDYGSLIEEFQLAFRAYGEIKCQDKLTKDFKSLLEKAREKVNKVTTYLVIANITNKMDCQITTFQPFSGGKPSAISNPETKLIVYTVDILPWVKIGNTRL